ncbi:hypothetical protein [uncultured Psychrobacter sp.]|uniref:hypothetical protein n=1 Tax=uncultured Psychrobacter sp. TaxID=259303 RepID=UPI0025990B2A|nr:hypothetical protein [uncultured Psychrobacter sp.]
MTAQNWISEITDDINTLSQVSNLNIDSSKFRPVQSHISHQTLNQDELRDTLQAMGNVTGWVQATGAVKTLNNEVIAMDTPLLNGEWVIAQDAKEQTSYVLDYIGNYTWLLQTCVLDFSDAAQANSLAERLLHKEVGVKNSRYLVYQKLWQQQAGAVIADKAFFVGFDG